MIDPLRPVRIYLLGARAENSFLKNRAIERRVGTRAVLAFYKDGERSKWLWGKQLTEFRKRMALPGGDRLN